MRLSRRAIVRATDLFVAFEIVRDLVVNPSGSQTSGAKMLIVPVNPFGMMPTTVKARPLIEICDRGARDRARVSSNSCS